MRLRILVAVIAALGLVPSAGADGADDAWKILEKAEKFELYSLDPDLGDQQKDGYHGWKVLGHTTITDKELRKKLVVTLGDAIDNFVGGGKKKCFDPRHAIRVTVEKKTYDFLICFQCDYVYVYSGDKRVAVWNTGPTPEKLFDQTLSDVKVPLPKSPDE